MVQAVLPKSLFLPGNATDVVTGSVCSLKGSFQAVNLLRSGEKFDLSGQVHSLTGAPRLGFWKFSRLSVGIVHCLPSFRDSASLLSPPWNRPIVTQRRAFDTGSPRILAASDTVNIPSMSLFIDGFAQIVNNPSDSVQIFKVERLGNLSVPACNVVDLSDSKHII